MLNSQLVRFLIVGTLTVIIDGATYRGLTWLVDGHVEITKAVGFITGTVFSYFANRHFTFAGQEQGSGSWWKFAILYLVTLGANVGVNSALLNALDGYSIAVLAAFLVATGTSATLNFLGMKFVVFRARALSI